VLHKEFHFLSCGKSSSQEYWKKNKWYNLRLLHKKGSLKVIVMLNESNFSKAIKMIRAKRRNEKYRSTEKILLERQRSKLAKY
jgi:hypothetical protein